MSADQERVLKARQRLEDEWLGVVEQVAVPLGQLPVKKTALAGRRGTWTVLAIAAAIGLSLGRSRRPGGRTDVG